MKPVANKKKKNRNKPTDKEVCDFLNYACSAEAIAEMDRYVAYVLSKLPILKPKEGDTDVNGGQEKPDS